MTRLEPQLLDKFIGMWTYKLGVFLQSFKDLKIRDVSHRKVSWKWSTSHWAFLWNFFLLRKIQLLLYLRPSFEDLLLYEVFTLEILSCFLYFDCLLTFLGNLLFLELNIYILFYSSICLMMHQLSRKECQSEIFLS